MKLSIVKLMLACGLLFTQLTAFGATIEKSKPAISLPPSEYNCLVKNVYHEARGEPVSGQIAVAQVTLNRAPDKKVCEVVNEPGQFSWVGKKKRARSNELREVEQVVKLVINGHRVREVGNSTSFHATKIKPPKWTRKMKKTSTVGNHVFYKK